MPVFRVTIGFAGANQGWSESHLLQSDQSNPTVLAPLALQLGQKRADVLGNPFSVEAVRFAKYLKDDGTRDTRGVYLLKQHLVQNPQSGTGDAEPGNVACIVVAGNNTFPNVSRFFLGAPSDAAVSLGGNVNPAQGQLGPNFNSYANFLINPPGPGLNKFGWGAFVLLGDFKIESITSNLDFTLKITTAAPHGLPIDPKVIYPSRVRRVNQGVSPVNGEVNLIVDSATTFSTEELIAFGPAQVGGFVKVYKPTRVFLGYDSMVLELQTGKHKRGRPFGSAPGRAKRRIRA